MHQNGVLMEYSDTVFSSKKGVRLLPPLQFINAFGPLLAIIE